MNKNARCVLKRAVKYTENCGYSLLKSSGKEVMGKRQTRDAAKFFIPKCSKGKMILQHPLIHSEICGGEGIT